ncbi:hypothetical protein CkaCkLH20_08914 [Colletotrichum karsti]|uniref:Metallo-beta-lactamase domain-containing protein n=1 Tax=Colletotrichum karsti TaxID=1095194 RepID=A0A9P6I0A4_9PEZI|nr:uncharacterized protein CkaCkLH20_08914 [Colletotrichum karsti]KAF9873455.1 hypothetical protein CkaCkLH20_08914 [Colletotrichum karsti]
MGLPDLAEIDSLEVAVIITDELDPISPSPNPSVQHASHFMGIPVSAVENPGARGGAASEMKMSSICCGSHGLSLMITAKKDERTHTLLFDAGPEDEAWERNANRMRAEIDKIEHIVLSHYHRDHSGGLLRAIEMINERKDTDSKKVVVDLHPSRPEYRGIATPYGPISLEADPTFPEVERAGAQLLLSKEPHTILDNMFLVSGEIPRQTSYETGLPGGIRFTRHGEAKKDGLWEKDEQLMEERYVMCKIKDKGLVIFTGCGHAGVINTALDAQRLSGKNAVYYISGGYHMSDASPEKLQKTIQDMKDIRPRLLHGGHCTGWKFKTEMEKAMPGVVVPCTVGLTYRF